MFDLVVRQGIARLTLARPEARNAIPAAGWVQLGAALDEVSKSGARVLLLAGAGDSFCAGADVRDFEAMAGDTGRAASFRLAMRASLDRLRRLPIATIAVVDGACFGAGVALAIACDLRLSGEKASFAITPAKLGLSYPHEDRHRLVSLVGPGQAARLLFSARAIDGA